MRRGKSAINLSNLGKFLPNLAPGHLFMLGRLAVPKLIYVWPVGSPETLQILGKILNINHLTWPPHPNSSRKIFCPKLIYGTFSDLRNFLAFWAFFPSFPGIWGVQHREEVVAFLGGVFPAFSKKKSRKGRSDEHELLARPKHLVGGEEVFFRPILACLAKARKKKTLEKLPLKILGNAPKKARKHFSEKSF